MLGHLVDSAMATPARVDLNALNVAPKRARVERWLEGAIVSDYTHLLHCILLFQEHFECLINDTAHESLDIPLVLLIEGGL